MGSVAERLVFGMAAAAEGDSVAQLDGFPVRALYSDMAGDPDWAVGDDSDTLRQIRFVGLSGLCELICQRSGRAALDHRDDLRADHNIVGLLRHRPDVANSIFAEGREGTDGPVVLDGD